MKFSSLLISAAWFSLFCGCSQRLDFIRYDNPKVRALQSKQLDSFLPSESERVAVMRFFAPRVGFIDSAGRDGVSVGSGRAAAIARDGYYLTASHVVEDQPFFLSEVTLGENLKEGLHIMTEEELDRIVQTRTYPGRIVWQNSDLDLAIVKFQRRTPRYFKMRSGMPAVGKPVFSADDSGLGVMVTGNGGIENLIGNGPFLVAGSVISTHPSLNQPEDHLIATDIIVRGGMSGAPLAERDGTLRGIILHVDVNKFSPSKRHTVASMISPKRIRQIIAADRKGVASK